MQQQVCFVEHQDDPFVMSGNNNVAECLEVLTHHARRRGGRCCRSSVVPLNQTKKWRSLRLVLRFIAWQLLMSSESDIVRQRTPPLGTRRKADRANAIGSQQERTKHL